jgi:hypothetical protein
VVRPKARRLLISCQAANSWDDPDQHVACLRWAVRLLLTYSIGSWTFGFPGKDLNVQFDRQHGFVTFHRCRPLEHFKGSGYPTRSLCQTLPCCSAGPAIKEDRSFECSTSRKSDANAAAMRDSTFRQTCFRFASLLNHCRIPLRM